MTFSGGVEQDPVDVVAAAASFGLPGADVASVSALVLTDSVVAVAHTHGVQGLLWQAVNAGLVNGTADAVELARDSFHNGLHGCLFAEETGLLTVETLDAAGVESRALKGLAISHLDHFDPAQRMFADADILIRRSSYAPALDALTEAGFRRDGPAVRASWEQRFGKAIPMRSPNGGQLDLHLSITGGYFGMRVDHDRLWVSTPELFELGGRSVKALDREDRLLQACCHSVLGGLSGLRAKRDIAQLVLVAGADWQETVDRSERHGADLVVAEATRIAWTDLHLDLSHPFAKWAARHRADDKQARAIASYRAPAGSGWGSEGRGVLAALGPVDRVRFLAALAVPSRDSLRVRQRGWTDHLRRGKQTMRPDAE